MTTEEVYAVVQEIDKQLELINSKVFQNKFEPVVELRNRLILKYKPDPNLNWEIKNKRIIKALKKANWELVWR